MGYLDLALRCFGVCLLADGIGSYREYDKQKVLVTSDGKGISMHWLKRFDLWVKNHLMGFSDKLPKGKMIQVKQSLMEHIPRIGRMTIGIFLMALPPLPI